MVTWWRDIGVRVVYIYLGDFYAQYTTKTRIKQERRRQRKLQRFENMKQRPLIELYKQHKYLCYEQQFRRLVKHAITEEHY